MPHANPWTLRTRTLIMSLLILSLNASPLWAQSGTNSELDEYSSTTTVMFGVVISGGGLGLTAIAVLLIMPGGSISRSQKQKAQEKQVKMLDTYIQHNALACRQDFALGAGHCVRDLAAILGIHRDEHRAFAKHLRRHREELTELMGQSTPKRTWRTYKLMMTMK